MFNLTEKKSFMSDLVARIFDDPGCTGKAPPKNLDDSGNNGHSRNTTNQLAQELLRLEDLALFKMQDFRLLFVARCLQLHFQSGKAYTVLSRHRFEFLVDMLRVILREGNNDGDFLAVRMVYLASGLFGIYCGEHLKLVKVNAKEKKTHGKQSHLLALNMMCLYVTPILTETVDET